MRLAILLLCSALVFGQSATPPLQLPKAESPAGTASQYFDLGTGTNGRQLGALDILTDIHGVDFGPYLQRVVQNILENWNRIASGSASLRLKLQSKKERIAIEFAVTKEGKVQDTRFATFPVDLEFAHLTRASVADAFPPLPDDFTGPYLRLRFRVYYNLDSADLTADQISQNQDYGAGTGAHGRQLGALDILSDTQGVDFGPYLQRMVKDVRENWYHLIPESARTKKGKLAIEFAIKKDGKVADMRLIATSGDVGLDRPAWGSITASNPFPPLPSEFTGPYLALRFRFYYPDKADLNDLKTADLIRTGNEARQNGHYDLAIDLLKRAIEADARSNRAWDLLGLAYFDDGQDGLAINAFQKQIEVNPLDGSAFNDLGRVYLRQRKYDEADKWFKKQIEVQPLEEYAHANLGISLLEQHKYEDAIPELEKAASIRPNNATPQLNLGQAYLNLGQDEKAMAAFDKALTIAATPPVWNNIAYRLSLKKSHLDRAQQYAESAVSATAANLPTLSLEKLNRRDLGNVFALAIYWDTLGWVAFAGGKLDIAERYVSAAWQLGGDAEEADHLGQIYEKRENKSEAAHLYALAMNARRPEPETRSRLAALVGDGEVDAAIEKYRNEQLQARTLHLSNTPAVNGRADFFVLLSPGQGTTVTVESTSFVSGDENLKVLADSLHSAKFTQQFPDPSVKIVRRGTLDCKAAAECTFLLALPVDVKSVN
jgi:Flp pilus assembly protein TadD